MADDVKKVLEDKNEPASASLEGDEELNGEQECDEEEESEEEESVLCLLTRIFIHISDMPADKHAHSCLCYAYVSHLCRRRKKKIYFQSCGTKT